MEHSHDTRKRPRTVAAVALIVVSMVMTIMALVAPAADAHNGKFEHDDKFPVTSCPDGTVPNGASVDNLYDRFGQNVGCTHPGYSPIGSDAALCEEARGFFVEDLCTFDRARACGDDPASLTEIGAGMCLRLALVLNEFAPAGPAVRSVTPACIESALVQENAASQSVGSQFSIGTATTCS